jgi:hypothetical protein
MDKENVIQKYDEYYSALKKKGILQFATMLMNLEDIILSKKS